MDTFLNWRCRKLGTPEYVLAKAGLLAVDAEGVKAGDTLTRLYGKKPVPSLERVVPALIKVAYVCNAELGGAIDVQEKRVQAVVALEEIGLSHRSWQAQAVFTAIEAVIASVAEECRSRPPWKLECGTSLVSGR